MKKTLNPPEYLIKKFGGMRALGRAVDRPQSAIHGWKKRKCIPMAICKKILTVAAKRNLKVTPRNLILGG